MKKFLCLLVALSCGFQYLSSALTLEETLEKCEKILEKLHIQERNIIRLLPITTWAKIESRELELNIDYDYDIRSICANYLNQDDNFDKTYNMAIEMRKDTKDIIETIVTSHLYDDIVELVLVNKYAMIMTLTCRILREKGDKNKLTSLIKKIITLINGLLQDNQSDDFYHLSILMPKKELTMLYAAVQTGDITEAINIAENQNCYCCANFLKLRAYPKSHIILKSCIVAAKVSIDENAT